MTEMSKPHPPKWANRFLAWYCNSELLEQLQGDVHELFYWRLAEKGHSAAKRQFIWDVLRLFKWSNIKRKKRKTQNFNNMGMIKNYFKIGLRNLWKQRMPSTINIIGLSLAIGCCLVAFKWIEQVFVSDSFHSKSDQIFLLTPTKMVDGDQKRLGYIPSDWSEEFGLDASGVKDKTRVSYGTPMVKSGKIDWPELVTYVDAGYFRMFDFKMIYGSGESINDLGSVIMSESQAEVYFGQEFPLGKQIMINQKTYVVSAIIADAPKNTSLRHGILLNHKIKEQEYDKLFRSWVFVEIDESSRTAVELAFNQVMGQYNDTHEDNPYTSIEFESLNTMAHNSLEVSGGLGSPVPIEPVILLACIGGFMLTLATFNYINVSISMAMKRMKEIGVRKVIGSKKRQLITQFLVENLLLIVVAVAIGLLLAAAYFLPGFNQISGSNLEMNMLAHGNLWIFLLVLILFITVASGAYPAFYVASFKPVNIFRGNQNTKSKRRFTGVLLSFQMTLAIVTIMAAVMFVYTNKVQQKADWGYTHQDKWGMRYLPSLPKSAIDEAILALPEVQSISRTVDVIGDTWQDQSTYLPDGRSFETAYFEVSNNYLDHLGIELVAGRYFSAELTSENDKSVIVNERFMKTHQGNFEPNMIVNFDSTEYRVVGVVKDFHYRPFNTDIIPAIFIKKPDSLQQSVSIKVNTTDMASLRLKFEEILEELAPDDRHIIYAYSEVFDSYFEETKGMQDIMVFVATLAILLSSMGLYGLVSVSVSSRMKDFGIKKILGASGFELSKDVYKRFAWIIGIAIVLGGTISVFLIGVLLESLYSGNQQQIGILPLLFGGFILASVAYITIYTQIFQVKRMNPASTLRVE